MPSLKEFRNRIVSVKSTQKITKALQMVATAKLKRAQEAAQRLPRQRPRALQAARLPGIGERRRPSRGFVFPLVCCCETGSRLA